MPARPSLQKLFRQDVHGRERADIRRDVVALRAAVQVALAKRRALSDGQTSKDAV